jgi:hypothetical protein
MVKAADHVALPDVPEGKSQRPPSRCRPAKVKSSCLAGLALLLAGCTTINIPPERAAWAESVCQQIAQASDSHFVYIPVENKEERDIVETLAFKQGKSTQRIKKDGKITECVFAPRYL